MNVKRVNILNDWSLYYYNTRLYVLSGAVYIFQDDPILLSSNVLSYENDCPRTSICRCDDYIIILKLLIARVSSTQFRNVHDLNVNQIICVLSYYSDLLNTV